VLVELPLDVTAGILSKVPTNMAIRPQNRPVTTMAGPGRPLVAISKASLILCASSSVLRTLTFHLVHAPMVVFCGQVSADKIGTDAFQEADILSMSQPCTKLTFHLVHGWDMDKMSASWKASVPILSALT
jgi:hypothetical protein